MTKESYSPGTRGASNYLMVQLVQRNEIGVGLAVWLGLVAGLGGRAVAQDFDAKPMLTRVIAHEEEDVQHRGRYSYLSNERSDRTGGHLWTEHVVETKIGKIRFLMAEDGVPLNAQRSAAERARMAEIAAHPEAFQKREMALKNDETHAKEMLSLLPKAFLFDQPVVDGEYVRMHFRPNPAYAPQSMEERVLTRMSGTVVVEQRDDRLRAVEGRLPADVSIGFGLLATIKAGSSFATTRERVEVGPQGDDWKTVKLATDVNGKAIFFKAIAKKEQAEHSGFKRLPEELPFEQAVALAESQP